MSSAHGEAAAAVADKFRLVAILLPGVGVVGGVMRAVGSADTTVLAVTVPLFVVAFLTWRLLAASGAARTAEDATERKLWQAWDKRQAERLQALVLAQKAEFAELRERQLREQQALVERRATRDQMASMMDRHRREYEALLDKLSA